MNEITLFVLKNCPHCILAKKCIEQLRSEDARYASLRIREVDERAEKKLADAYDYYLVPSFFWGNQKLHEGHAEYADVKRVFDAVLSLTEQKPA